MHIFFSKVYKFKSIFDQLMSQSEKVFKISIEIYTKMGADTHNVKKVCGHQEKCLLFLVVALAPGSLKLD